MRLIDADMLSSTMYHMAFEEDTGMQMWDSGCWIRYKLFETVLGTQPTVDIVRCGECIHRYVCGKTTRYNWCKRLNIDVDLDFFCRDGERRADDEQK